MVAEQARSPGSPEPRGEALAGGAVRPRSRFGRVLVCPFCKDRVSARGTVACARGSCGALYHRECWDECAGSYGGCAIFGCGSHEAREVTRASFVVRLARLALAASVFPPRVARAFRRFEEEHEASVFRAAFQVARPYLPFQPSDELSPLRYLYLATVMVVGSVAGLVCLMGGRPLLVLPLLAVLAVLPFLAMLLVATGYVTLGILAAILPGELRALSRADATVHGKTREPPAK